MEENKNTKKEMSTKDMLKKIILRAVIVILVSAILEVVNIFALKNDYLDAFCSCLIVLGIVMFIKHLRIVKNEKLMKKYTIARQDERNISIATRAGYITFYFATLVNAVLSIVFQIKEYYLVSQVLSFVCCGSLLLYLILYFVFRNRD
ncbi:MAG: DUF2178 domain-containing protein [Clostridia bacterium]|nr:DUF2178 domain-containing protein [Clostridia bacterium]